MPLKLKNLDKLPNSDHETVNVLGLEIPKTRSLPFGGQVSLIDLQNRFERGDMGEFEYLMRVFCLFTWRLPKREHIRYEWLAQQDLEPDEISAITRATSELLTHLNSSDEDAEEQEAPQKKGGRSKTSTRSK